MSHKVLISLEFSIVNSSVILVELPWCSVILSTGEYTSACDAFLPTRIWALVLGGRLGGFSLGPHGRLPLTHLSHFSCKFESHVRVVGRHCEVQVRAVGNRGLLRAKAYYLLLGSPAWLAFLLHCHSTEGAAMQQRSMTLASHIMSWTSF